MTFLEKLFHRHEAAPMEPSLKEWCCRWCYERVTPTLKELVEYKRLLSDVEKVL